LRYFCSSWCSNYGAGCGAGADGDLKGFGIGPPILHS